MLDLGRLGDYLVLGHAKLSWLILYAGRADSQLLVVDWEVIFLADRALCDGGDVLGSGRGWRFDDSLRVGVE